jgi:LysM repeat protein
LADKIFFVKLKRMKTFSECLSGYLVLFLAGSLLLTGGCVLKNKTSVPVARQQYSDGDILVTKKAVPEQAGKFGARLLKVGMSGDDVKVLQNRLRLAGFLAGDYKDGVFDEETRRMVIEYQKGDTPYLREVLRRPPNYTLAPTGIVNQEFCRHIIQKTGFQARLESHKVRSGETLGAIASRYQLPVKNLALLNHLKPPYFLKDGQTIKYIVHPGRDEEAFHLVTSDDTLLKIAQRYKVPVDRLVEANCLFGEGLLSPGEKLYVPLSADR